MEYKKIARYDKKALRGAALKNAYFGGGIVPSEHAHLDFYKVKLSPRLCFLHDALGKRK
ncbi:hypothetical protein VTH8203_02062 [Vibrio thalassae]|uniref:Uncharacterized protein n=1 Tax=Vibrio thalassae TaxID=1243014 RepID=A0A240EIE9_9VIBR|nr:hypothetical protein VTH8203_02062 [Vibrio thalassae]